MNQNLLFRKGLLGLLILLMAGISMAQEFKNGTREGVVRVKLRPELITSARGIQTTQQNGVTQSGIYGIDVLNKKYQAVEMKRVFPYSPKFEDRHQKHGLHLWYEIKVDPTADPKEIARAYGNLSEVNHAEPIYQKKSLTGKVTPFTGKLAAGETEMPFNDPYLPAQWHYDNQGQTGGTPGADISLFEAWEEGTGSSNVIVSIHDEGIDTKHEDLAEAMWVNEAELNGEPGVDDDGNGYKDDIYGFNFAGNIGAVDPQEHGTHVAGTVGAISNNGVGVAGIAGGSGSGNGVRLMSCQIMGGVGIGNLPDSYVYAADMGAVISQNSWGFNSPGEYELSVLEGIKYFVAEAGSYPNSPMKGGVVFFAAGNENIDGEWYPGYWDEVCAVSALNARNEKSSYSNFGEWVDIAAPGGESMDDALIPDENIELGYSNGVLSTLPNNGYGFMDGTSMACPHVSGVAALVVAKHGGEGFTNETLMRHLTTLTDDLYNIEGNSNYIGKLGIGALNAATAMATDNKIVPETIAGLLVKNVSQDFATLEWSAPADQDDKSADSYLVYASTEPITEATLAIAREFEYKMKAEAGSTLSFEVTGLKGLTKYYFGVKAVDRWGNKSKISNIVDATTNAGPDANIAAAKSSVNITINTQNEAMGEDYFELQNTGAGLLRWNLETRHVSSVDAWSKNTIKYPEAVAQTGDQPELRAALAPKRSAVIQPLAQERETKEMLHFDEWSSRYFIGETDVDMTNSTATRFVVGNADGFNLQNITTWLNVDPSFGDVIVEVYRGENIQSAQIIYAESVSMEYSQSFQQINLKEQIFFEKGEVFWLVFHIPAGQLYPLGASVEYEKDGSLNCYYSSNMGKSWARFEDVYYDNQLVWIVAASGYQKYPEEYISLNPISGELASGDSTRVDAQVNGTTLINGTYKSNLVINTNETGEPMLRVPATITVSGNMPKLTSPQIIDFGSVLVGQQKTLSLTIKNEGYGRFNYPQIQFSNPDFSTSQYLSSLSARSEVTFDVVFKPSAAGNSNSTIRLFNSNGQEYKLNAFGVGAEPPVIDLNPADSTFEDLTIGDTLIGSFEIVNNGKYPLKYFLPQYSDEQPDLEINGSVCRFGYSLQYNEGGTGTEPAYEWHDISGTGTELTDYTIKTRNYFYAEVPIGFQFPFFGKAEEKLYVTSEGLLSFDTNSTFNETPARFKKGYLPTRYISATGTHANLDQGGKIYTQNEGNRFIVQYDNMKYEIFDWWTGEVSLMDYSFQFVLHANGDVEIFYSELPGDVASTFLVAMEDAGQQDGILMTEYEDWSTVVASNSAVAFKNPGLGLFSNVSNTSGILQVGEKATIGYTLDTKKLNVQDYKEQITILSNDPVNSVVAYTAYLNVTKGGAADVQFSTSELDFGKVFQGDSISRTVRLLNPGTAYDVVDSAMFRDGGKFTFAGEMPVSLSAGSLSPYIITINADNLGLIDDEISVFTQSGDTVVLKLAGEIVKAPMISSDITAIVDTLDAGTSKSVVVNVSNNGGSDLHFAPIGNDWIQILEVSTSAAEVPENSYRIATNFNGADDVVYQWTDISTTGTKIDSLDPFGALAPFWKEIELPFTFTYWGNKYNTVAVGYNPVLAFDTDLSKPYPTGGPIIPTKGGLNNYIAGLFGIVFPNDYEYDDAGIFYQYFDDRLVVQYNHLVNGFGMGDPMSMQMILLNDGSIKMQYNYDGNSFVLTPSNVSIGVENADGTDGVSYSYYQDLVTDGTAVLFTPIEQKILAPGASMALNVNLNAKSLYGGDYHENLALLSNTPKLEYYNIPVDMHVNGTPELVYTDTVDFGKLMIEEDPNPGWGMPPYVAYEKQFSITNTGSAAIELSSFVTDELVNLNVSVYILTVDWFGREQWMWVKLSELAWNITEPLKIEPGQNLKFKASLAPGVAEDIFESFSIVTDSEKYPEMKISFAATAFEPPVLGIDTYEITVIANTADHVESRSLTLDNIYGKSDLDYKMELIFNRPANEPKSAAIRTLGTTTASTVLEQAEFSGKAKQKSASVAADEYNRTLRYFTAEDPESLLGYGGNSQLYIGTRFRAPNDGFNLSHVSTWYTPGDWLNSDIEIKIYAGSESIYDATEVHSETVKVVNDKADTQGGIQTFKLSNSIELFPNEQFFVVFRFPTGAKYPAGYAKTELIGTARDIFSADSEVWYDMGSSYSGYGWMISAMEEGVSRTSWVTLTSDMEGSMEQGGSSQLNFIFDASMATLGTNSAKLYITSNDPKSAETQVNLNLIRNQGPAFADGSELSFIITEEEELNYTIEASDVEGDEFTLSVDPNVPYLNVISETAGVEFNFKPDYDAAGLHSFNVTGIDSFGNTSTITVNITVENVNRVPEVLLVAEDVEMYVDEMGFFFDVNKYFADPDAEILTLNMVTDTIGIVEIYQSETGAIVQPRAAGVTHVTVSATDFYGATVTQEFTITVKNRAVGIETTEKSAVQMYPNPTSDILNIRWNGSAANDVEVRVMDATGSVVLHTQASALNGSVLRVDMNRLVSGTYFVEIISEKGNYVEKVVKR